MKILDKYIYKRFLAYEIGLLSLFSILIISSQIMHLPSVFYHIGILQFVGSLFLINISFLKLQYFIATTLAFFFTGIHLKESREIIAIKSLGVSKKYLLKLILKTSIILIIFAVIFSFFLVPKANRERAKFITDSVRNYYMEAIQPKNFFKFPGDSVIYVEDKQNNTFKDIFLFSKKDGRLITAEEAYLKNSILILKKGLIQIPSKDGFSILKFKKYELKLDINYKKDYTYDDFKLKKLIKLAFSKDKDEKNKAIAVIFERIGYIIPFFFIGIISFFLAVGIEKEKEILLGSIILFIIAYTFTNFYLLKLVEKGILNPIFYLSGIILILTGLAVYLYKRG